MTGPSRTLFTFPDGQAGRAQGLVLGPDRAPYVLDRANKTVCRIDLKGGKATPVYRPGQRAAA